MFDIGAVEFEMGYAHPHQYKKFRIFFEIVMVILCIQNLRAHTWCLLALDLGCFQSDCHGRQSVVRPSLFLDVGCVHRLK